MYRPESLVPHARRGYYVFDKSVTLEPSMWVPTITALHEARTYGQQHAALSNALLGYAAYAKTPMSLSSGNKLTLHMLSPFGFKARFRTSDDGFDLRSAQFGRVQANYPIQREVPDSPTFAVIDIHEEQGSYHDVVRTPHEQLAKYTGEVLSREAAFSMTFMFNDMFPAFNIGQQVGIDVSY